MPLSVALTLDEGHKVSREQSQLASFFIHFSSDQNEICGVEAIQDEHNDTASEWDIVKWVK